MTDGPLTTHRDALSFIAGHTGDTPSLWLTTYRERGGGYEGLQAVAETALLEYGALPAPDFLSGDDAESVFVRRYLSATASKARERCLVEGYNVAGMDVDEVEMLPVPEHFTEIDYVWAIVKPGTPGAVAYWRFRV